MQARSTCLAALATVMAFTAPLPASAADWPSQPVRIVVAYPAGGGVDVLARAVAQSLSTAWGQSVVVENRPGANTLIATEAVARATDGHTLLVTTDATFTINPHLYQKLPYSQKDFAPINMMVSFDQLLVANAKLPDNTLKALIDTAKAEPGKLSYASYGAGSQPHLAMEIFKKKAGVDILHVPYRGVPQALNAALAGEVPLTWSGVASVAQHIASGKLKPLGYAGKTRLAAYPNVPTFAEAGYPEVDANVWVGLFAPAGTPADRVERISNDVRKALSDAQFQERHITPRGFELRALGPADFSKLITEQAASRTELVKVSGAKAE